MPNPEKDSINLADVQKLFVFADMVNAARMGSMVYTAYQFTVQPVMNFGRRILDYAETDDPETKSESSKFDRLENQLLAATIALQTAKKEKVNRRLIASAIFGRVDPRSLSEKEHGILHRATQSARDAEFKYSDSKRP